MIPTHGFAFAVHEAATAVLREHRETGTKRGAEKPESRSRILRPYWKQLGPSRGTRAMV